MRIDLERLARSACFVSLSFAGLVVLARSLNPIPSRTRPLNSSAPMVLWLKPWESRSLPGLPRTKQFLFTCHDQTKTPLPFGEAAFLLCHSLISGAATEAIFRHDRRAYCQVHCPFISRNVVSSPRNQKRPPQPRSPQCVNSFVPSLLP